MPDALEVLRRPDAFFQAILESAPNPIVLADTEGTVLFINQVGPGLTREQVIGTPAWKHVHAEEQERVRAILANLVRTGEPTGYEVRGQSGHTYAVRVGPVRAEGRIVGMIFVAFDITELRELQARVAMTDRLASLGTLVAGVAHEINNPLTYVLANLGWVDRYLEGRADAEQPRAWMRDALEGVHRIRDIVSDLRSLSKARDDRLALTDVRDVLDATLRLSQSELRHRARVVRRYGDVPPVAASESRLGQVFLNLLVNAAHAIPSGDASRHLVTLAVSCDAGRVVVEISDTGVGIEPEMIHRVFEPFVTTKRADAGTGLGLYISRNIVSSLGGEITVESAPGRGSTFRVALPIPDAATIARADADTPARLANAPRKRLRILLVDDEPSIVGVLRELLNDHEVTIARSGREAIALSDEREFDVILCDLVMPDQTGMDVYEHVRERRPGREKQIVFMTGGAYTSGAREFLRSVQNEILEKPFSTREMMTALARCAQGRDQVYAPPPLARTSTS